MTSSRHPETGPLRLGACVRSTPRAVWALAALFAALMAAYSLLVPVYHGADESKHVDMLVAVREPGGWPAEHERVMNEQVLESTRAAGYAPGRDARTAEEAVPRAQRPTLDELAADAPSTVPSQMWQHPPLGYVTTAITLGVVTAVVPAPGGWAHDQIVGLARLLGGLLLVPLPLLAFWTARRLGGRGAATSAAVLAVAVPGVVHVGATVNNDGLLIVLVGAVTLPLVFIATGDLSLRTALTTGLLAGFALLTKGFALFVPAWIIAAYLLAAWRGGRRSLRPAATAAALSVGVAGLVGGWWWLRNLRDLGVVQPQGLPPSPVGSDFSPELAPWLARLASTLPRTFWGSFGWVEAPLPWAAVGAAAGVITLGLVIALVTRRRGQRWRRADVALLLGAVAGTAAIMVYGSWTTYLDTGRRAAMHGRYLMAGVIGLVVAAALGLTVRLNRRWAALLPLGLLAGAGALHLLAGVVMVDRFWRPADASYGDGLASMLAWSPWPPAVAVATGALVAAAFVWAASELGWSARRARRRSTPDPQTSERAESATPATTADNPAGT